ncbi:ribonucleoprotein PTB-binding 2 isoform X2 [Pangasianodon hypophthalmus]|uniref:ribonucleoprotein PTB-binding 2 isoform X2 n=1 Tax=Pangasianodon hypophthalmus TaxID=310915 RepID=UPI0023078AC4|nr:ribonucleoprotein PTB-binding 2 isoform X2 [Pangasianodon hypophthalmus]
MGISREKRGVHPTQNTLRTARCKMAAASSMQPPTAPAVKRPNSPVPDSESPESRPEEDGAPEDTILRDMAELEPEEIERRLEKTRRELSNRRKIVIKNLPQDATNQEVHDILREYELKYCFVDRNKGTAFVTLLNGDQAQDAIRSLHQTSVRGRDISVQLQPTDSLLCVTNLPHTFTGTQFQELVRSYGNIERSFLVYSELTGHSKGYGFVEYMKKDSASRARSELLGKVQGERLLMVQWSDVNQLSTAQHIHSKCLCVERLPVDFDSSEELAHIFSEHYKPVFCQLAQDEGSAVRGFAVVEYETAEQAEAVLLEMDRHLIQGQEIRLSLCSPGTSGRSTLAALIAAQGVMLSNKKGLLPEPNLAQLLNSMTNPAALQVLMRPYHSGKRGGKFRPHSVPFLRPPLTAALLQLGKAQQNAMLGNGLVLQNLLHMHMAQQQLLHIKDKHITNIPSLLGDPSRLLLHKVLALRAAAPVPVVKGLIGDSPTDSSREAGGSGAGRAHMSPGDQNGVSAPDKQPAVSTHSHSQTHGFSSGSSRVALSSKAPVNHNSTASENCTLTTQTSCQMSLLGEPPKEVKLPSNPYLNMASVLPGVVLQAPCSSSSKGQAVSGTYSSVLPPASLPTTQYSTDCSASEYTNQYTQQYSQEAMQQWYQHYQAQGYSNTSQESTTATEYNKEQAQAVVTSSYGDYTPYMQAVTQYYSQTQISQAAAPGYQQRDLSKARGQKREYPTLAVQEVTSEGPYVGQHSQGLGGQYADYFKKKRI